MSRHHWRMSCRYAKHHDADHRMRPQRQRRTAHRRRRRASSTRSARVPGVRVARLLVRRVAQPLGDHAGRRRGGAQGGRARAVRRAPSTAIDLRTHSGEHPRLGAVDVVPVHPDRRRDDGRLRGAGEARRRRQWRGGSSVPVYLYEEAASQSGPAQPRGHPARRVRGARAKMAQPEWAPDFGPAAPHPSAGASVIGARMPLIAYNINLATDRLDVAKKIAAAIRHSSGGLPLREGDGHRARGPRDRAGVDEPDELREDADLPRVRGREARGRALRRHRARKRDRRPRAGRRRW